MGKYKKQALDKNIVTETQQTTGLETHQSIELHSKAFKFFWVIHPFIPSITLSASLNSSCNSRHYDCHVERHISIAI